MPFSVVLAFAVLGVAAVLLALEVWLGRPVGAGRAARVAAGAAFGAAAVAGATLLTALSGAEWPLALALVPLTALSTLRFGGLVLPEARPWVRVAVVGAALAAGVVAALRVVPVPLTRGHLSGTTTTPASERPTVRPYAGTPVRG